jgi:hypothetical protein
MKKILFTLTLLFSLHSFGQSEIHTFSNPVADADIFLGGDYYDFENAFVVPENKYMIITRESGDWAYKDENGVMSAESMYAGDLLPSGTKIYMYSNANNNYYFIATFHNYNTDSSLSFTNVEFPNKIKLFPNPTTSEVALNSDKDYQIEVFDLLGNKVMELTGNTINMENLSSATYIVNALDLETQESLSYKIIKK